AHWDCVHLGEQGCTVYHERPLVCRLFGTTPRLACPHGRGPALMIDPAMDAKIANFFRQTRHVLV
ncbi:MAG: YkgJ family cysteine cluster protein, partial [Pseudomonadota bacterium]